MTATYINRQAYGAYISYDLVFEENGESLLRLGGVNFLSEPSIEDMENRVIEIAGFNLPDYEINQIIT
jgi:hypothetical protein